MRRSDKNARPSCLLVLIAGTAATLTLLGPLLAFAKDLI